MSDVLINLTGLWKAPRRNTEGQCYLVGRVGAAKLFAFKNRNKQSDSDPDWILFLTEPSPPRQAGRRRRMPRAGSRRTRRSASGPSMS